MIHSEDGVYRWSAPGIPIALRLVSVLRHIGATMTHQNTASAIFVTLLGVATTKLVAAKKEFSWNRLYATVPMMAVLMATSVQITESAFPSIPVRCVRAMNIAVMDSFALANGMFVD
mmetsp:Transcript_45746/g.74632  ORF Transcript_45746/g.74632 Transcript_45746/m.74632 type:complete len:117 (+) Transcript_45746:1539-1889(+)